MNQLMPTITLMLCVSGIVIGLFFSPWIGVIIFLLAMLLRLATLKGVAKK